jgi:hypothetical protein
MIIKIKFWGPVYVHFFSQNHIIMHFSFFFIIFFSLDYNYFCKILVSNTFNIFCSFMVRDQDSEP